MNTPGSSHARYHFDRAKPFYPIVMSYLMQLHGIKELAAVGSLGTKRAWDVGHIAGTHADRVELQRQVEKLLGPLELTVTGDQERLTVAVEFVACEFVQNHRYLLIYQVQAALCALVMAHEVTKGRPYRTTEEKWEFLRHCRNAAAHNGRWYLTDGEPRRPAAWRGTTLVPSMNGRSLFIGEDGAGSLRIGDPIALLWDIERDNPAMQHDA